MLVQKAAQRRVAVRIEMLLVESATSFVDDVRREEVRIGEGDRMVLAIRLAETEARENTDDGIQRNVLRRAVIDAVEHGSISEKLWSMRSVPSSWKSFPGTDVV